MDEFDIEVGPIDLPRAAEHTRAAPPFPVRSPFAPRLSRRARSLRATGTLGVLLLALAVLVAVTPGASALLVEAVLGPPPAATPSLVGGEDRFAVEHQVPWGTLLVDGHRLPPLAPPRPPDGTRPPLDTFGLPRGRHQLEYQADPFPPLRCAVSVPAAPGDTCPLDPSPIDYVVFARPRTRLLDLGGTVDRLPAAQASALVEATQRSLDAAAGRARGTLAPGDHYLDAAARVAVAREALTAAPAYTLANDALPIPNPEAHCAILCAEPAPWAQRSADEWRLYAFADLTWRYQGAAGDIVLASGPPGPPAAREPVSVLVGARLADGGWRVRLIPPDDAAAPVRDALSCPAGAHYLDALRARPGQTTVGMADLSYQWLASAAPRERGCLFGGGRVSEQGTLLDPVALVLYRYGALLAVNDAAHRVFPHLPMATAHERALALGAWLPRSATSTLNS